MGALFNIGDKISVLDFQDFIINIKYRERVLEDGGTLYSTNTCTYNKLIDLYTL